MKKNFLAGLAILLPIALTIMIVLFIINLLTYPFLSTVESIFNRHFTPMIAKLAILISLAGFIILIGALGRSFISDYFLRHIDSIVHRIPGVRIVYKAITEVVHTLFTNDNTGFTSIVLAPFPFSNTYSIGFVTKESLPQDSDPQYVNLVSVFVPAAPNPSMGFMLLYKRDDLIYLDIKKEDAIKLIVSCGVTWSDFQTVPPPGTFQDISAK